MVYPLASSTWDEAELKAIQTVIDSGMHSMGRHVAEFEEAFARFVGSRHCVMVNSGSSANLLMVAALRYRKSKPLLPGMEVVVPAVSWSTTYFPLHQYGLKLRFVDIDPDTLNYDLEALEAAITPATRALMVVNLLGNPNDFDRIGAIAKAHDLDVIEDNCESMGATFAGRQAGTFGRMGSFSTFFSHHISTMEGGMVVTDDDELHHILLCLRAHGWTRNLPATNHVTGYKSDDPFEESFRFVLPGYNVRPLEMSGAIGKAQLQKLPAMIAQRRENALRFRDVVSKHPFVRPQRELGASSWFGFAMVIKTDMGVSRTQVLDALSQHGIEVRPIVAGNFAKSEAMKWIDHSIHGALANAAEIDTCGFFVGNHHYPLDSQMEVLDRALSMAGDRAGT